MANKSKTYRICGHCNYVFKDGVTAVFKDFLYTTDKPNRISELDEVAAGENPVLVEYTPEMAEAVAEEAGSKVVDPKAAEIAAKAAEVLAKVHSK